MKSITHDNLLKLLAGLADDGKIVYAPVRKGQKVFFAPVKDMQQVVFDYIQTTESPKSVLFPRYEPLISFEYQGKEIKVDRSCSSASGRARIVRLASLRCKCVEAPCRFLQPGYSRCVCCRTAECIDGHQCELHKGGY